MRKHWKLVIRFPRKYLEQISLTQGSVQIFHANLVIYATFRSLAFRSPTPPTNFGVHIASQARKDKNLSLSSSMPQKNLLVSRPTLVQRLTQRRKNCIIYAGNAAGTERISQKFLER